MMTTEKLIALTEMFYQRLDDSGLTRASLEELGNARKAGLPFKKLSVDLRRSLMTIVRNFLDGIIEQDMAEALASSSQDAIAQPSATDPPSSPATAATNTPDVDSHESQTP